MKKVLLSLALLGEAALMPLHAATMASQPWVTNRISQAEARLSAEIVAATNSIPAPGNYASVSNRAMSAIQEHQSLEPSTNYTDRALGAFAATGSVSRADTYGTPTRWTDATGCVWEVSYTQWSATNFVNVDTEEFASFNGPYWWPGGETYGVYGEIGWYLDPCATPRYLSNDADAMELVWAECDSENAKSVTYCRSLVTNLVGRVALMNDVTSAIREQSLGGIWDRELGVWWTPVMSNGALTYQATTNANMNAED